MEELFQQDQTQLKKYSKMINSENIKQLISSGHTLEALEALLLTSDLKLQIKVIQLKNRYHRVISKEIKGISSQNEIDIEINRINNSILLILNNKNAHRKNTKLITLTIIAILLVLLLVVNTVWENNKKQDSLTPNVTVVQVEPDWLNMYLLFTLKDVVERFHEENPKYYLDTLLNQEDLVQEEGIKYKVLNVILNPGFSFDAISKYIYLVNNKKKWIPIYANVRDDVMLTKTPLSNKDSLVNSIPELKILDHVSDTIILTGIYSGVSKIKYNKDLGSVYCELYFNKKGMLREYIFENLPD